MDIPTIHPPTLRTGDTIAIVAPAGTVNQLESLNRGISTLERLGFRVRYDERILQSWRYLAGSDDARAAELMAAFEDSSINAIIGLRGGYGCSRLIPLLSERRLRSHPKVFMGFSDLTTLHLYFRRRFGWVTVHGPMAASPALWEMEDEQKDHLVSMWTDPEYRPTLAFPQLETWAPGVAEGTLIGGCLAIVVASVGTSYEIKTEGKILFLEDQGEHPYRLDRMLTQLKLAGKLQALAGVLLGTFKDCEPTEESYSAADTLREILLELKIPIIGNFPAGHGMQNWALPFGSRVQIDANTCSIKFLDGLVR
jgi:muramoyltetrapeptide carboxypeptidase